MEIRESTEGDLVELLRVEMDAFGEDHGPEIVELVRNLLNDPSAQPMLSLLAINGDEAVGHVLFTKAQIIGSASSISAMLLAPLAVAPDEQSKGVGGKLIEEGLELLSERGVELVFVLGHPEYYPRHDFRPAGALGFEAPYPIPDKDVGAWMVLELRSGVIGSIDGKVQCADALDKPEYWHE